MPPRTRKPRRRSSTPRPSRPPAATPAPIPWPGPGERIHVLDIPFGTLVPGAIWHKPLGVHLWVGAVLPTAMEPFASRPYTVHRWVEDTINGTRALTGPRPAPFTPRPLQEAGADAITEHATSTHASGVFLLADEVGCGKTGTAVIAANRVAQAHRMTDILVIADRPAAMTIPHWTRTIAAVGDGGNTWVVTTWDRLAKVNKHPWDIVIADEAHALRHRTTKRWSNWAKLAGWNRVRGPRPYVIAITATPANDPLGLRYLSPTFARANGGTVKDWISNYEQHLAAAGLHLQTGRYGWAWTDDPQERQLDIELMNAWQGTAPASRIRRAAPWGACPIDALPVDLSAADKAAYRLEWAAFCHEMNLARQGRDKARGRALALRFRQKAGLLRVDATCEWAIAQVDAGRQVVISCEFVATAAAPIRARLQDAGLRVATLFGQEGTDPERERLLFQTGQAPVAVMTATSSLSLHAGETLPSGRHASSATRVGIMHQARYSGLLGRQITGRTHRDYQVSPWWVAFAEDTIEKQITEVMAARYATAGQLAGDEAALSEVSALLGADWLPAGDLTGGPASAMSGL